MGVRVAGVGIELTEEVAPLFDLRFVEALPLAVLFHGDVGGLPHLLCGWEAYLNLLFQVIDTLGHTIPQAGVGNGLGPVLAQTGQGN